MNNKLIIKIYITMSILIIMFLIGILMNLLGKVIVKEEKITNLEIELDSEKEKVYQLELDQKRGALNE